MYPLEYRITGFAFGSSGLGFWDALKSVHDTISTFGRGHRLGSAWHHYTSLPNMHCRAGRVATAMPVHARPHAWPYTARHDLLPPHVGEQLTPPMLPLPRPGRLPRAPANALVGLVAGPVLQATLSLLRLAHLAHTRRTRTSRPAGPVFLPPSHCAVVQSCCAPTIATTRLLLRLTCIAMRVSLPAILCQHARV